MSTHTLYKCVQWWHTQPCWNSKLNHTHRNRTIPCRLKIETRLRRKQYPEYIWDSCEIPPKMLLKLWGYGKVRARGGGSWEETAPGKSQRNGSEPMAGSSSPLAHPSPLKHLQPKCDPAPGSPASTHTLAFVPPLGQTAPFLQIGFPGPTSQSLHF